jgi:hypothetical protein
MKLSILMPSNRPFAAAEKSVRTALVYAEACDAMLIVSDNSRDPEKRRVLANCSPRLVYSQPEGDGLHENLLNVYRLAKTEFILMMGDDDEIYVGPNDRPIDLAALGPDYIGAKPLIAVANSSGKVIRVKDFAIAEDTPGQRVMAYNDRAKGDNAAYYSIFRRAPFVDLHRFFLANHPLKSGNGDWALAATLFACGKIAYDPGTVYKYNFHQWDDPTKIGNQIDSIYEAAGLEASADKFKLLFLFVDMMILSQRAGSPLDAEGQLDLAIGAGAPIFNGFCREVARNSDAYSDRVHALTNSVIGHSDPTRRLDTAIALLDDIRPGLSDAYDQFRKVANAS